MINLSDLEDTISETSIVSVMFGNKEVGTIKPIKKLQIVMKIKQFFIQTLFKQKNSVNVKELDVDLLSISSHKLHASKGIGVLYIKDGVKIDPMI